MKRFIPILAAIAVCFLFTGNTKESYKKFTPPGTVRLFGDVFIDQTEIRNVDYREYLYWTQKVFGPQSQEYLSALPDTASWKRLSDTLDTYVDMYLRHPAYGNYPLVGATKKQAERYCEWRSDRVYEFMLYNKGILVPNNHADKDNYFSRKKMLDSTFTNFLRQPTEEDLYPFPEYRLPTAEEWEMAAGCNNDTLLCKYGTKKPKMENFNTRDRAYLKKKSPFPLPCASLAKNKKGIYDMIGNVAEIINKDKVCKGGSWANKMDECLIKTDLSFKKPNACTGFRCVCEMKYKAK